MPTLTAFPSTIVAGDSLTVARAYADAPVADGWSVAVVFVAPNGSVVSVDGTGSGITWTFALAPASSASLPAGTLTVSAIATKTGQRATLETVRMAVLPDPTDVSAAGTSELAHVERVIAACRARLEGKITDDVAMYQLPDGVMVQKLTLREVRELLAQYTAKRRRLLNGGRPFTVREVWYAAR